MYTIAMKYLGIDFGTKRVGIALSDDGGTFARPFSVVPNDSKLLESIQKIISEEKVESIVIGESKGNKVNQDIEEFIGQLTLTNMLPIDRMNESFSSYEAHAREGKESHNARQDKKPEKPDNLDARAAAVILQRFLETQSKK